MTWLAAKAFLTSRLGAVAIAAALFFAMLTVEQVRIHNLKGDLAHQAALVEKGRADLSQCHTNNAALQSSITAQNAAVDALRAESDARVAQSQKAASSARAVAESFRQTAGDILGRKAGVDKCRSADELISEAVR